METKLDNTPQESNIEYENPENIYEFVEGLFLTQGERNPKGDIRIEMDGNPRFLIVQLYYDKGNDSVEVYMNKVLMGYFKKYTGQGYQYEFQQRRRDGIRKELTLSEQFMESLCDLNDKILLRKAY